MRRVTIDGRRFGDRVSEYETLVDDRFDSGALDRSVWIPYYLPQWAGRERSLARYRVDDGRLELFVSQDQPRWIEDIEGDLRVSSLQTGCFAGPVGSTIGQHRTHDALTVVEEQPTQRLVTPQFAAIELRARWEPVAGQMVALWMIGFEDEPERSSEICVCEIFGDEAGHDRALVGMGVHPFNDPDLVDAFDKHDAEIDISEWHDYAAIWTADDVTFFIDGHPVEHVAQSPQYPMQLMLNTYDFEPPGPDRPATPFQVDRVRVLERSRPSSTREPSPSRVARTSSTPAASPTWGR